MDNKVYNIKQSDLGKVTFDDGTTFIYVAMDATFGRSYDILMMPSIEESVRYFSSWVIEKTRNSVEDSIKLGEQIVDWLLENWPQAINSLKIEMANKYGFDEFKNKPDEEWIKTEPEMVPLTLAHIAAKYTNGYLKCPFGNMEIMVKFVKQIIAVNFWEEGNPNNILPIK